MKKIITILLVVLVSGCTIRTTDKSDTGLLPEPPESTQNELPVVEDTEPHPISLPALIHRKYSGSDFTVGNVLATTDAYTRYYITYVSDGLIISGIMNVPHGDGPFPLLILNHGYIDPAVYTNGRGLKREQDYLARRGYVVIHPDYRNHADSDDDPDNDVNFRLGYTIDVINAVYAAKNSGLTYIDAERVGMLGHSMGGGITQNILVVQPDLIDAAVLFAPVSGDYRDSFEKWMRQRTEVAERAINLYGEPSSNPDFWDNVSAQTFYNNITAPILLHHGDADTDVPLEWSDKTVNALTSLNKNITYEVYPGEPHEFINAWPLVMQRTVDFFDEYVK